MADQKINIAVLPFVNTSADPDNEYFSDGISEEIINALGGIDELKVISRTSSFYFKNKNIPLKEIAKQLHVGIILEGSVRRSANMVRITAQLIDTQEDYHFWSETWDRKLENIFEVQDEISLLIADILREELGHFEIKDHLVKPQTGSLDAYQYGLKARYHFNKWNPQDVQLAIEYWEKAVSFDPQHTESFVGLADAYGFMATTEYMPREEAWGKAVQCTNHAYKLDPEDAGVHYQLANIAFFTNCDYAEAGRHARRSVELKPNYPEAQQFMSFLHILKGDFKTGKKHLQLALDINPLSQETKFYQAFYEYRIGTYEQALKHLEACLIFNPKNIPATIVKAYTLIKLDRINEVKDMLEALPEEIVLPDEDLGIRCLCAILQKDELNVDQNLSPLENRAQDAHAFQAHSYLFMAYVLLNKFDKAFDWLEKSLKNKSSILLLSFSDPLVEGIHKDPRYQVFHKNMYSFIDPQRDENDRAKPLLDEASANNYYQVLCDHMDEEVPYLNPGLSLRSLAAQIIIHPNQLSWLLNKRFNKNFSSFVNDYRINRFKALVKDPANKHISIIGLAYESGFNSKSVFNTYFKKSEGMTPGAFQKQFAK